MHFLIIGASFHCSLFTGNTKSYWDSDESQFFPAKVCWFIKCFGIIKVRCQRRLGVQAVDTCKQGPSAPLVLDDSSSIPQFQEDLAGPARDVRHTAHMGRTSLPIYVSCRHNPFLLIVPENYDLPTSARVPAAMAGLSAGATGALFHTPLRSIKDLHSPLQVKTIFSCKVLLHYIIAAEFKATPPALTYIRTVDACQQGPSAPLSSMTLLPDPNSRKPSPAAGRGVRQTAHMGRTSLPLYVSCRHTPFLLDSP